MDDLARVDPGLAPTAEPGSAEPCAATEAAVCARYAAAIRTFARRRLRGREAVEDFTQDVLLLLVEALRRGTIEDPARTGGFVLGICRNVARERVRVRSRRDALFALYGDVVESVPTAEPLRSPREIAHLEDCLSQLAQRTRDVLRHAYVAGESNGEIAELLAMSEGNVRVVRHRARESLRDCMERPSISWEAT